MSSRQSSKYYRDDAVVLRTWKLGEADKILSLLTRKHGRVRAVAKGVRRTRSKFGARLEPATCVSLQLYEGRGDLDTVTGADTIERFDSLRSDIGQFARASAMLEAVDQLAQAEIDVEHVYTMLVGALRQLDTSSSGLIVPAFFMKVLAAEGFAPQVQSCVECGNSDELVAFDPEAGVVLCATHRRGRSLTPEAIGAIADVLGGRLRRALEIDDASVIHEVERVATELMEHHLERQIRSVRVVE
jgi:DNA repair protein RecO (recombination protein O)